MLADLPKPSSAAGAIGHLRRVAWVEGVSFLLLLGVAMPLKYVAGLPLAVKIVGWAHGVLFVWLLVALGVTTRKAQWSMGQAALVVLAALLPFGPFVIDRRLQAAADVAR